MKKHNNNTKNPDISNTHTSNTDTFNGNSAESNLNISNLNNLLPLLANLQSNNSSMIANSNLNVNQLLLNLLLNNNNNNNILQPHAFNNINNNYLGNNNRNSNSILSHPSANLNKFLSCQQQKASLIKAMNNSLENNNFLFKNSIIALEQDYNTRASSIKCCYDDLIFKIDAEINRTQSELINEFRLTDNTRTNFSNNVNNMNQLHIPNKYSSNNVEQSSLFSNNLLLSLLNPNNNLSSNNISNTRGNTRGNTSNNDIIGNIDLNAILDITKVNGVSNTKPLNSNNFNSNNTNNNKSTNNDNCKNIINNNNNNNINTLSICPNKIRNNSSNTRSKTKLPIKNNININNNNNNNIKRISNTNGNNNFHNTCQNHSKTKTNKKSKSLTNIKESTIKTNSKLKQINKYNNNISKHSIKRISNIPNEDDFDDIDDFFDKSQISRTKLSSSKYFSKKIGNSNSEKNRYNNIIDDDFDFANDKEENKFDELFKPANEIQSQLNVGGNEVEDLDDCFNVGIGNKKKKINVSNEILDDYYNKLFGEEIIETITKEKNNSKGINTEESKKSKDNKDDDEKKKIEDSNNVIKSSCFVSLNNNKIESIKEESESIIESNVKNKNGNNRDSQEIDKKNNESVLASINKEFLLNSSSKKNLKRRTCDINSIYNTTNTDTSKIINNTKTYNDSNIKENSDTSFINTAISISNIELKHKHDFKNENTLNSKVLYDINNDVDIQNTTESIKKEDDRKYVFSESDNSNNNSNNSNNKGSGKINTKNIFKTKNKLTINKESSSKVSYDSNDSNSINMSLIDSKKSVYNEAKILLDDILTKKVIDEVIIKNNSTKINANLFIENKQYRLTKELRYEEIEELEFLCICYYQDEVNLSTSEKMSTSSNVNKSIIRKTDKAVINNNSICCYCKNTYIISLKTTNMKDCFINYLAGVDYNNAENSEKDIIDTSEDEAINKLILFLSNIDFAFYYTITIWKSYTSLNRISGKSNTEIDNKSEKINLTILGIFSLLKNTLICILNKEELSEEMYKRSSLISFKFYNSRSTILVYIIKITRHAFENKIIDVLLSDGYLVLEISNVLNFDKAIYNNIVNNKVRVGDQIEIVLSESKRNSIIEKFII